MIGPIPKKQAMAMILLVTIRDKKEELQILFNKKGFTKTDKEAIIHIITEFCLKEGEWNNNIKNSKDMKALVREFVQIG